MSKHYQAVLAIIFNNEGKVLLSKRFEPKHKPTHNKLQFPGGGIEKGETLIDAVIREVKEEADIEIKLLTQVPITIEEKIDNKKNIFITLHGFPAIYVSGTISCVNDPESSEIGWFAYEDIDFQKTLPGTKKLIDGSFKIWKKN